MYIGVQMMRTALPAGIDPMNSLIFLITTGAAIYLGYSLIFLKSQFGEFLSLARS